ncbi:MAG: hypothetical protein JNM00_04445 [Flavobacteriales bacterium]|nr:hypothetical protein [Flavobacteriales bacterium]
MSKNRKTEAAASLKKQEAQRQQLLNTLEQKNQSPKGPKPDSEMESVVFTFIEANT